MCFQPGEAAGKVEFPVDIDQQHKIENPFLAPLAVGQRAYVMARCPSYVRSSVR